MGGFEKYANRSFPSHERRGFDSGKMTGRYSHKLGRKARHGSDSSTGIEGGGLVFLNLVLKHPADGVFREILLVKFGQHFVAGIHFLDGSGGCRHRGVIDHWIQQRFGRWQMQGRWVCGCRRGTNFNFSEDMGRQSDSPYWAIVGTPAQSARSA